MYLGGCELHIQTLKLLIVLTLKQSCQRETMFDTSIAMTIIACRTTYAT